MEYVLNVCFPRSGHNILIYLLRLICRRVKMKFSYCEFYLSCQQIPCKDNCYIIKNHDFELRVNVPNAIKTHIPIDNDKKYLVMYRRDPILQLEAFFRYENPDADNDLEKFVQYYKDNIGYYNAFVEKWINNDCDNILKVEYYDFVNEPLQHITSILNFIYPNVEIDPDIIKKAVELTDINLKYQMDPALYDEIAKRIQD
jgi:hypothetical protein